jgi:hypothetical protein
MRLITKLFIASLYVSCITLIAVGVDKMPSQPAVSYIEHPGQSQQEVADASQREYQAELINSLGFKLTMIGCGLFVALVGIQLHLCYRVDIQPEPTPLQQIVIPADRAPGPESPAAYLKAGPATMSIKIDKAAT